MGLTILKKRSVKLNFILYLIVLVLVNVVSSTLFFRLDLTVNKKYSLSEASRTAVSSIEEPLTIKADRKSTRLNSSHIPLSRMPSSA